MTELEKLAKKWINSGGREHLLVSSHIYEEAFEAGFKKAREMVLNLKDEEGYDYHSTWMMDEIKNLGEKEIE